MKRNRIEDMDLNLHSHVHLIFDKGDKSIQWRKDSFFKNCCWENWISACGKLKLDPYLSPCTSVNSKWFKDLNIRPKTLKLIQERVGNRLKAIGVWEKSLQAPENASL
jgi:hypothetical protein